MKPTTETTYQELKDFKQELKEDIIEIKSTLKDIYTQTKRTNGRVTTLEVVQNSCPAKELYVSGRLVQNRWQILSSVIAVLALGAAYLAIFIQ